MVQRGHLNAVIQPVERDPPRDGISSRKGQTEIYYANEGSNRMVQPSAVSIGMGLKPKKNILDGRRDMS